MAYPNVTSIFAGPENRGLQVGHSSGSIVNNFYPPAGKLACPLYPHLWGAMLTTSHMSRTAGDTASSFMLDPFPAGLWICGAWKHPQTACEKMRFACVSDGAGGVGWGWVRGDGQTQTQTVQDTDRGVGSRSWRSSSATAPENDGRILG